MSNLLEGLRSASKLLVIPSVCGWCPFLKTAPLQGYKRLSTLDHETLKALALPVTLQVVLGLSALFEQGIVHQSIRPEVVWVHKTKHRVQLGGLLTACFLPLRPGLLPKEKSSPFRHPERSSGNFLPSPSHDLYAVGALLEWLGPAEDVGDIVAKLKSGQLADVFTLEFFEALGPSCARLLRRMSAWGERPRQLQDFWTLQLARCPDSLVVQNDEALPAEDLDAVRAMATRAAEPHTAEVLAIALTWRFRAMASMPLCIVIAASMADHPLPEVKVPEVLLLELQQISAKSDQNGWSMQTFFRNILKGQDELAFAGAAPSLLSAHTLRPSYAKTLQQLRESIGAAPPWASNVYVNRDALAALRGKGVNLCVDTARTQEVGKFASVDQLLAVVERVQFVQKLLAEQKISAVSPYCAEIPHEPHGVTTARMSTPAPVGQLLPFSASIDTCTQLRTLAELFQKEHFALPKDHELKVKDRALRFVGVPQPLAEATRPDSHSLYKFGAALGCSGQFPRTKPKTKAAAATPKSAI